MRKELKNLKKLLAIQGTEGNWNYDTYMLGMYNGLELAVSVLENRETVYRSKPENGYLSPLERKDSNIIFEVGKYYEHTTGRQLHVICEVETAMRGKGLLAEQYGVGEELIILGTSPDNAVNWKEISLFRWESNFC